MMDWKGKSCLVTGATGFLGGALVEALLARGAEVIALVRDVVPQSRFQSTGLATRAKVVRGNLENYDILERAINEYAVDTVFHLAAQAIVGVANRNPISTFEANIKGTWVLLEACRRNPTVERVVVASSDKAYGDHEHASDNKGELEGTLGRSANGTDLYMAHFLGIGGGGIVAQR